MRVEPAAFGEYWDCVTRGDSAGARAVTLREYDGGAPLIDLLEELVCAAQAQVGALWAADEWNVAQEHRATSVGEDVVAALSAEIDTPPSGRHVVITCADGEWHALPPRVLAAALRSAGHRVTFLGASVPARHLDQLLHDTGPDVTAISCALPTRLFEARQMIEASRAAGIPAIVGGRGFGLDGRWGLRLGADAWAPDARRAAGLIDALPAFTEPAPPLATVDDAPALLRERWRGIVADGLDIMRRQLADVASYDQRQIDRTAEDIGHIVDFLRAALLVDDVGLFTEFVAWLRDVLVARGVPAGTVGSGLRLVADVIASEPGPWERALHFLDEGAATVGSLAASG